MKGVVEMKSQKSIKKMLLGIALLVFSVWCLIYGYLNQLTVVIYAGVLFHWVGIILVILGFVSSDGENEQDS